MPEENSTSKAIALLRRMSSFSLREDIESNKTYMVLVNPDGTEVDFDSAVFDGYDNDPLLVTPIGRGGQGVVYAARIYFMNQSGALEVRDCVLKRIQCRTPQGQDPFEQSQNITKTDRTSTENNIIKLIGLVKKDEETYALFPYCDFFLDTTIERLRELSTEEPDRFKELKVPLCLHVMLDLCEALIALHLDKGYVHGDIKPANIGYCRGHWCLNDMDSAKEIGESVQYLSGTYKYMYFGSFRDRDNSSNPSTDLFAMAMTVLELLLEEEPPILSLKHLVTEREESYRHQLKEKYGEGKIQPSLSALLQENKNESLEKKLILICRSFSSLASDQPDLLSLKRELEELIKELFTSHSHATIKSTLDCFYESMKAKAKFTFRINERTSPIQDSSDISLLTSPTNKAKNSSASREDSPLENKLMDANDEPDSASPSP